MPVFLIVLKPVEAYDDKKKSVDKNENVLNFVLSRVVLGVWQSNKISPIYFRFNSTTCSDLNFIYFMNCVSGKPE